MVAEVDLSSLSISMYLAFNGSFATNPAPPASHLLISSGNPANTDILVLDSFLLDEKSAYNRSSDGFRVIDGRSARNKIRFKGLNGPADRYEWKLSLLVKPSQLALFESFMRDQPTFILQVIDNWRSPSVTVGCYASVSDGYASAVAADWYLLQCTLSEI